MAKIRQKGGAAGRKMVLQPGGTVAFAASPGLAAIFVAAVAAGVGVLHFHQVEKLLPVGALLRERRRAIADLDPAGGAVVEQPGLAHVAKVFAAGDRAGAQSAAIDRFDERLLLTRSDACTHKISHNEIIARAG
jgi:hypothetical protein